MDASTHVFKWLSPILLDESPDQGISEVGELKQGFRLSVLPQYQRELLMKLLCVHQYSQKKPTASQRLELG